MWFSEYGLPNLQLHFPYQSRSPVLLKVVTYKNKNDVLEEVYRIINEKRTSNFGIGQSLFFQLPLFCNPSILLSDWCFEMIQDYHNVTKFNIPIAKDLDSCNVWQLDCFNVISQEINAIKIHERKKHG